MSTKVPKQHRCYLPIEIYFSFNLENNFLRIVTKRKAKRKTPAKINYFIYLELVKWKSSILIVESGNEI